MPFLVRWPKMIKAGSRSDEIINNTDFAPTILDLAGVGAPDYMHGRSFAPILAGKTPGDWPKSSYYRYWMHMAHHDNPAHFGVRTKEYKLIFFYGRNYKSGGPKPTQPGWELYDMKKDPHEMNNIYRNPKYAKVVKELKADFLRLRKKYEETDEKYPHIQKVIDEYWDK
jgi:N-acetylglucosamine-6-sulfatase